jgi:YHS domain-containing protein
MAHRSNIIPVSTDLDPGDLPKQVQDPVCGAFLKRENVKQILIRADTLHYFCSKDCLSKFTAPSMKKEVA